ncbi:hypothetical protein GUJ93_ZPchr0004g39205 [Zizania palustris]|uniref:IBH1-like N-terminal domain-containing protein n=1 Tax=Zizania palustris TaxID=103762 RepID=A0A8J5W008_ZIZPA|nr:hypothetical protein GUJ93_ZPchr0004g39205 [Zizania palustris]
MDGKRTTPPHPNPNPSSAALQAGAAAAAAESSKARMLAFHFLRALSRIHRVTPVRRRTRTIRRAAYSSMARAAGPRRAWSRALLGQARARRARRAVLVRRRVLTAAAPAPAAGGGGGRFIAAGGETSAAAAAAASRVLPPRQAGEPPRADALRRLVPGGDAMEYCSLLDETADYLRSLRAQVQLMQGLVDLFSCQ